MRNYVQICRMYNICRMIKAIHCAVHLFLYFDKTVASVWSYLHIYVM